MMKMVDDGLLLQLPFCSCYCLAAIHVIWSCDTVGMGRWELGHTFVLCIVISLIYRGTGYRYLLLSDTSLLQTRHHLPNHDL